MEWKQELTDAGNRSETKLSKVVHLQERASQIQLRLYKSVKYFKLSV